jgi:ubiquinone/menaquinone biosynthesis C-methylase UbiE
MFNVPAMIKRLELKPGYIVADLGTGREARMALAAGQVVGNDGMVYAVDIVKSILPAVQTKAAIHGINNIHTVWSDLEIYGAAKEIADNSVDAACLVTILFQSRKHQAILREAIRILKPGGRLVIADWKSASDVPLGPAPEMRVKPEDVIKLASDLKLKLIDEFDAGRCHWGLLFQK